MRCFGLLILALIFSPLTRADEPPGDRIVCVSKQLNEFIFALGAQSQLVARDLTSVTPPQILALPSVGYHRALSAEGIVSMRPSVFLTDGNVGPDEVLERLRAVNIPIKTMKPGESIDDAESLMIQLGAYLHREQRAAQIVDAWKAEMQTSMAEAARAANGRSVKVLMVHFGQLSNSYLALSKGSIGDRMIGWAGGQNAIEAIGGMTRLTPELIAQAAPDIIIATDVGFDRFGSAEKFKELPGVALTPAGRQGRIYRVEEADLMYFSPRSPEALRRLSKMLHP